MKVTEWHQLADVRPGQDSQSGRPELRVLADRALYEAKMIHHFAHRWASYNPEGESDDEPAERKADPRVRAMPRYWIKAASVDDRLTRTIVEDGEPYTWTWSRGWLMGWRDITGVEKVRTVIASAVPRVAVGHTMSLFFFDAVDPPLAAVFLANWCSLVLDFTARQKVGGTHLTFAYLKQFPFLPPSAYTRADLDFISRGCWS
jgi:hypothetical protein